MSRWTQESEVLQGPNPAKVHCLGLHHGKHMLQSLTELQDTHNLNTPLEHGYASAVGDIQPL